MGEPLTEPCRECNGATRTWPTGEQDAQHQSWCTFGMHQAGQWNRNPDPDPYYRGER